MRVFAQSQSRMRVAPLLLLVSSTRVGIGLEQVVHRCAHASLGCQLVGEQRIGDRLCFTRNFRDICGRSLALELLVALALLPDLHLHSQWPCAHGRPRLRTRAHVPPRFFEANVKSLILTIGPPPPDLKLTISVPSQFS